MRVVPICGGSGILCPRWNGIGVRVGQAGHSRDQGTCPIHYRLSAQTIAAARLVPFSARH